jgi:hypothetical protein
LRGSGFGDILAFGFFLVTIAFLYGMDHVENGLKKGGRGPVQFCIYKTVPRVAPKT